MTRNQELIVPIRDRRRGKRILTLKNARNVTLVALALVAGLMVYSEVRGPKTHDDYGRLFNEQVSTPAPEVQRAPQVVTEGQIPDQDHADPMLLSSAAREQYLGVEPNTASLVQTTTPVEAVDGPKPSIGDHVAVVGDANGVAVVQTSTEQRGTLGGGIFKQR